MEVLQPIEPTWIEDGDVTRCKAHDVTFPREESCPIGNCFGAPPAIAAENDAGDQLDDDEARFRASAQLLYAKRDELLCRAGLICNRSHEAKLLNMALDCDKRAARALSESIRLATIRHRRQRVDTLRKERAAARRRSH